MHVSDFMAVHPLVGETLHLKPQMPTQWWRPVIVIQDLDTLANS